MELLTIVLLGVIIGQLFYICKAVAVTTAVNNKLAALADKLHNSSTSLNKSVRANQKEK